jgi:hypothetical protein
MIFSKAISEEPLMRWFKYGHLREDLKQISMQFANLAIWMVSELPRNAERTVALRKLLEAKDAAVRAKVWEDDIAAEKEK